MSSYGYSLGCSEDTVLAGRGEEGELLQPRTAVFYDFPVPPGVRLPVTLQSLIVQTHGEQALGGMATEWESDRIMVTHLQRLYIFLEGVPSLSAAPSRSSHYSDPVPGSTLLVKVLVARILEPQPLCAGPRSRPATVFHDVGGSGVPLRICAACTLDLDLNASRICMECPGNEWFEARTLSFSDMQRKPCADLLFGAFWQITARLGEEFARLLFSPIDGGIRETLVYYNRILCQVWEAVALADPLGAARRGFAPLRAFQQPRVPAPPSFPPPPSLRQGCLRPRRLARASRSRSARHGGSSSRAPRTSGWRPRAVPVARGFAQREALLRIAGAGLGYSALQLREFGAALPGKGSTWRRSAE